MRIQCLCYGGAFETSDITPDWKTDTLNNLESLKNLRSKHVIWRRVETVWITCGVENVENKWEKT